MTTQVSKPLTLVMNIKSPEDFAELQKLLAEIEAKPPGENPINNALIKIGPVHFARFVFLSETQLAVITSYDGDFVEYIQAFTDELGDIFDALLSHMSSPPPLPVKDNLKPFLEYIMDNDRSRVNGELGSLFSAYPELTVVDILGLAGNKQQAVA
ncbi:MAG: hypothetical protein GXP16_02140 [Gammaproteobacteria bacterium]|nr:hypothetical protein [Gammaproteobacteria bacterium]